MGELRSINLGNLVSSCVHYPFIVENGKRVPLYTRNKGFNEDGIVYSTDYLNKCENTYNSPTNIRRVWVSKKRVVVQYWVRTVKNGKQENAAFTVNRLVTVDRDDFSKFHEQYINQVFSNKPTDLAYVAKNKEKELKVTGKLFGFLTDIDKLVISNIEEIYIDIDLLINDQVVNAMRGQFSSFNSKQDFYKWMISDPKNKDMVSKLCGVPDIGGLRHSIKRLARIVAVVDLDGIFDRDELGCDGNSGKGLKGKLSISGKNINKVWVTERNKYPNIYGKTGSVTLYTDDKIKPLETPLVTRQMYKFDSEYLAKFAAELAEKLSIEVTEANKEKLDTQFSAERNKRETANQLITALREIESQSGSLVNAQFCAAIAVARWPADYKAEFAATISPEDKMRYFAGVL